MLVLNYKTISLPPRAFESMEALARRRRERVREFVDTIGVDQVVSICEDSAYHTTTVWYRGPKGLLPEL